jgi:hypothetical protein
MRGLRCLAGLWAIAGSLPAQPAVGARAALIAYTEGQVAVDHQPVHPTATHFPEWKESSVITSDAGRAEIILGASAVMWIGDHTTVRMIAADALEPRLELRQGSIEIWVKSLARKSGAAVAFRNAVTTIAEDGLYRFDGGQMKVLGGKAAVGRGAQTSMLSAGEQLSLDNMGPPEKFDRRKLDALDMWCRPRITALTAVRSRQPGRTPAVKPITWADEDPAASPYRGLPLALPTPAKLSRHNVSQRETECVDTGYGVSFRLPPKWSVATAVRWMDGEEPATTITLHSPNTRALFGLYYRLFATPEAPAPDDGVRAEQRIRQGLRNYRMRPGSLERRNFGERQALTWVADYTDRGRPAVEYFIQLRGAMAIVQVFGRGSTDQLGKFREGLVPLVESLRMP